MRLIDPRTATRRVARAQAEGVDNEHIPTGWLVSIWLTGAVALALGVLAMLAPDNPLTTLGALVGVCGGGTVAIHLSIPLAPRVWAAVLTWRYPR